MLYKKALSALAALILLLSCSGSSTGNNNALLWKISGNGLEKPSYLFGTHHLVPLSFLDSIPGIHEAFESTEQTVGELDMSNMTEMQMKIMSNAMLPEGVTYESLLPAGDVALLDSTLTDLMGFGLNQFGRLKPAMLSNIISVTLYQRYYPSLASGESLDQHFQEEALKHSRPVVGLETTEDQIYVLLELQSIERQAEMLSCMVKHPEMLKEQMDEIQAAYHAQDLDTLWRLYTRETPDDPCPTTEEEKDALNSDRNSKWLEQLPAIMAERSSFIAVGSL
ncbi:MAG: TraB/GumN family protein, partial [Proteiniphilum sp.]|nr:TraB/GumN family protein [Proteiniphilum sp.]